MRFRDHYFKREATVSDSDTVIIDINVKDPISYIKIEYEATNGATSCLDHELHDDVSKIEVVDGSDVLASLSMLEWQALNFYELKKFPAMLLSEAAGAKQEESCYIFFGRYPDDPEFYLDPTAFRNPQLRLTHALTISATAGFATGTGKITVMARIIEEGAGPHRGFMMAKEKYSWTSAGSGDEEVDLPRDYPYRMILIKALLSTNVPNEIIDKIKLSIDADKYIPIDNYTEDIIDNNEKQFGMAQQKKRLLEADDGTALLDIYDIDEAGIDARVDDHIATIEAVDAEKVSVGLYNMTTPATPAFQTTAKDCDVWAKGNCPHAVVCIPFGDLNDPDSWFPAPDFGDIKLYLTQATANAACAIILQQLRS